MKNHEVFHHNPLDWKLVNDGVSSNNSADENTLRYELKTFVCEGQYEKALERILTSFLQHANESEIPSAWISGFYGSGKSHLVKILRYLWTDHQLSDGASARSLCTLDVGTSDLLKELTTLGQRGAGLRAVGGTLKSGSGSVRLRLLSLIFEAAELPENYPQAKLCLALKAQGAWDDFVKHIESSGKKPKDELKKLYSSKSIQEAYLSLHPHLDNLPAVAETLRSEYSKVDDISIPVLLTTIREALADPKSGELPYTLIVLDELQQFIGDNPDVALDVQEVVEACSKEMGGKLMIVATGQSALNDTPNLQRLLGRFTIKLALSDSDVESVIRKISLRKKDDKINELEQVLDSHDGEISRQLASTKIATKADDRQYYVSDYPLLPVRRRFWEKVLRSVDSTGSTGQLRTQLRVVHEANRAYADKPVGHVVAADFIYDQLSTQLVTLGELQKRFQEIIDVQKKEPNGALRSRVCSLAYLINKLPSEGAADLGIRSTAEQMADLLIEDLDEGSSGLRNDIPGVLDALVQDGVLMQIKDEYRLQTTEGASWEQEFQSRLSQLKNENVRIGNELNSRLQEHVNRDLGNIKIPHGQANKQRPIRIHFGLDKPDASKDGIPLWVRSGWSETQQQVIDHIRALPEEDPTLFLFIPKQHTDELRAAIADEIASDGTLTFKGTPATPEGLEAHKSMTSRRDLAGNRRKSVLAKILQGASLYLAGGEERSIISLQEAIQDAGATVLSNVYHRFSDADSAKWSAALKLAREGNGNALSKVDYQGDPDKHPVAKEILLAIGSGKTGNELRKQFAAPPYGWEQDAIDATLATLLLTGHLKATFQGNAVTEKDDQRKLGSASYQVQGSVLSTSDKRALRKFMTEFGTKVSADDLDTGAKDFIQSMMQLAHQAGGEAPMPATPDRPALKELSGKQGNSLLQGLLSQKDSLSEDFKKWQHLATLAAKRSPIWHDIQTLVPRLTSLPGHAAWDQQMQGIISARSLLNEQDPVTQLREEMTTAARTQLNECHRQYSEALQTVTSQLDTHSSWSQLAAEDKHARLAAASIRSFSAPEVTDTAAVLASLGQCTLEAWRSRIDALPAQKDKALATLLKELEPKAQHLTLVSTTIKNAEELNAWMDKTRKQIEAALEQGPVII